MARKATIYRVFIASPGDVSEERESIREAIYEWNATHAIEMEIFFEPVLWETHAVPEMGDRPQGILNRELLDTADILIGLFWTRIGTSSGKAISGTVEEIHNFLESNRRCAIYFSCKNLPNNIEISQLEQVRIFQEKCKPLGILGTYNSSSELKEKMFQFISKNAFEIQSKTQHKKKGFSKKKNQTDSNYIYKTDKSRLRIQADALLNLDIKAIDRAVTYINDKGGKSIKILDVGCADGHVTVSRFKHCKNIKVLGIDISNEAIDSANNEFYIDNFQFKRRDIVKLKKEEFGEFDIIFSALALHHMQNPEGVTHKLWSMLDDKGVLLLRGSDDGLKVNYPENDDLSFLLKTTNKIRGSSDREHGRKIYNHLVNLTPAPKKIEMDFQVDSTVGLDSQTRLDFYDDNYSFRANYSTRLANRDGATQEDTKLSNTLRRIVNEQRKRFEQEEGIYSVTVQNIAVAFKG